MTTAPLSPSANALIKLTVGCAKTFKSLHLETTILKVNADLESSGQTTKYQVKNIGVILETDLSFSSHVKAVSKSAKSVGESVVHSPPPPIIPAGPKLILDFPKKSLKRKERKPICLKNLLVVSCLKA